MLTIRRKVCLILKIVKEDVLYIFYILLTLIYKVDLTAYDMARASYAAVNFYYKKVKDYVYNLLLALQKIVDSTQKSFINKANNDFLIYSNLLAPPLSF